MTIVIILLLLNVGITLTIWRQVSHNAMPTTGTMTVLNNPNKGPQNRSRSDYDEYVIQCERQGKKPEPEITQE